MEWTEITAKATRNKSGFSNAIFVWNSATESITASMLIAYLGALGGFFGYHCHNRSKFLQ